MTVIQPHAEAEDTAPVVAIEPPITEAIAAAEPVAGEADETVVAGRKRRRRRRGKGTRAEQPAGEAPSVEDGEVSEELVEAVIDETPTETEPGVTSTEPAAKRRRRRGGRRHKRGDRQQTEMVQLEPQFEEIPPDVAAEALMTMISAIEGSDGEVPEGESPVEPTPEPEPVKPKRRAPRRKKATEPEPQLTLEPVAEPEPEPTPEPEPEPEPEKPARKPRAPRKPRVKKDEAPPAEPAAE
jgi:hypothetical protein